MRVFALVALLWLMLGATAWADTITPTRFDDPAGPGTCPTDCSLRQAVDRVATDRIDLDRGVYQLTQSAELTVAHSLTIVGIQADETSIAGRRVEISTGSVSLQKLAVARGGIVVHSGSVSIDRVDVADSITTGLRVENGTVSLDRSTVRGSGGPGVHVLDGQVAIFDTTVANNSPLGGAFGSGVVNQAGDVTLGNVTLVGNPHGSLETDAGADTTVENTIIGASPVQDGTNGSCVSPGQTTFANTTTGPAVTNDLGHNISEDTTCPLALPSDHAFADARLAPLHDNGGFTLTAAPLSGSPAIGNGSTACAPLDQRGVARQGTCEIGAIEAVQNGAPGTAYTYWSDVAANGATLNAFTDLEGEAGQVYFKWGINPAALINETPPLGAFNRETVSLPLYGLDPGQTYYFQAISQNASGSEPGSVANFTTPSGAPQVNQTNADQVTDTSARISFSLDPAGAQTQYWINYDSVSSHDETQPVTVPAGAPSQTLSVTLSDLHPDTQYTVRVVAANSAGTSSPDGATVNVATKRQLAGVAGTAVSFTDEVSSNACPASATIDWGDGPAQVTTVRCEPGSDSSVNITLEASHRYAAAGHYPISIDYATGDHTDLYALVTQATTPEPPAETPTPTPTPQEAQEAQATPTPTASPTPTPSPTPVTPAPVFHQSVVAEPTGTVLVKLKGSSKFVPLKAGTVPLGAQIDATKGRVTITSVPTAGGVAQQATFFGGVFTVTQSGAITDLRLSGPEPTCAKKKRARSSAGKKVKSRRLWGEGKGNFRTTGRFSSATVRGTKWLVTDHCGTTVTRVTQGSVAVRDFVKRKTIVVRAGKKYVARKRKPK
jgi:hypothetical protein